MNDILVMDNLISVLLVPTRGWFCKVEVEVQLEMNSSQTALHFISTEYYLDILA
jgi:hypothetical protein